MFGGGHSLANSVEARQVQTGIIATGAVINWGGLMAGLSGDREDVR
ncbi:MAG: hypothetical protein DIU68_020210 [Chloroflexota bacterium]